MLPDKEKKLVQLVVLTGMSGSGKSTALNAFEDMGFYCVDNLPIPLVPEFLFLQEKMAEKPVRIALVMDVRARDFLHKHSEIFTGLKREGFHIEVVFLDARDDILVHRYSQTRRRHPLRNQSTIVSAIAEERNMMLGLKEYADRTIDTSEMNVHQLRHTVMTLFAGREILDCLLIHVLSFGFKYGIPAESNMVFDVRFLPNPYFEPALKTLSGQEKTVSDYVLNNEAATSFLGYLDGMVRFLVPRFKEEGKAYLVLSVGCTGGRHRSVAVAEWLRTLLEKGGEEVAVTHRDINREA
jgi:UPF0042 nucleotide-binding protein